MHPVAPDFPRIISCAGGLRDRRWNGSSRATTAERIETAKNRFTTEVAFIGAAEDLLRNAWRGFVSATLPDGTIVRDEPALRALIAASAVGR